MTSPSQPTRSRPWRGLQVPPLENGDRLTRIDWFSLQNGNYSLLPDEDGVIRSQIFPGLWLQVAAMLEGNMAQVLAGLQAGLNSAEHQTFVQQLAETRSRESYVYCWIKLLVLAR